MENIIRKLPARKGRGMVEVKCPGCGYIRAMLKQNYSKTKGTCKDCGDYGRPLHGDGRIGTKLNKLYRIWASMKQRCSNPSLPNYKYYGGKGITFDNKWQEYIPFRDWALANGYKEGLTIDRIEGSKNYTPSNCQWLTKSENSSKPKEK